MTPEVGALFRWGWHSKARARVDDCIPFGTVVAVTARHVFFEYGTYPDMQGNGGDSAAYGDAVTVDYWQTFAEPFVAPAVNGILAPLHVFALGPIAFNA